MRSAAYFIRNLPAWIGWAKYLSFTTYTFQAFLNISSRQQIQGCVQRRRRGLPRGRNVRHGGGLEESLPAEHERVLWHALPYAPDGRGRIRPMPGRMRDFSAGKHARTHARTRPVIPLARLAKADLGPGCRMLIMHEMRVFFCHPTFFPLARTFAYAAGSIRLRALRAPPAWLVMVASRSILSRWAPRDRPPQYLAKSRPPLCNFTG